MAKVVTCKHRNLIFFRDSKTKEFAFNPNRLNVVTMGCPDCASICVLSYDKLYSEIVVPLNPVISWVKMGRELFDKYCE